MENKKFTIEEVEQFVHDHIQQKIDYKVLHLTGIDFSDEKNFEREFEIYRNALLEGIVNGISMCGGEVKGIKEG
jgi:hypothetical protein